MRIIYKPMMQSGRWAVFDRGEWIFHEFARSDPLAVLQSSCRHGFRNPSAEREDQGTLVLRKQCRPGSPSRGSGSLVRSGKSLGRASRGSVVRWGLSVSCCQWLYAHC